jgi:hypothetical protein
MAYLDCHEKTPPEPQAPPWHAAGLNTAFQYRFFRYFWPEFEVNHTWWPNRNRAGLNQVFLTPGLPIGRIPIHERVGLTSGAGYQIAVTHQPTYNHAVIVTIRVPF